MINLLLALTLLTGTLLRVWGLDFGLPYEYHVDERIIVHEAMAVAGNPLRTSFLNYGTFSLIFPAGIQIIHYGTARLLGCVSSAEEFKAVWHNDPTGVYLWARASSLLLFVLSGLLLYRIGRRRWNREAGLLAVLCYSILPLSALFAHYAAPQSLMTFLILLSAERALTYLDTGRRRDLILSAIAVGLSAATQYPLGISIAVPLLAVLMKKEEDQKSRGVMLVIVISLLAFSIGSFHVLLNPGEFLNDFIFQTGHQYESAKIALGSTGWAELIRMIAVGGGLPLFLITLLSAGAVAYERNRRDIPIHIFPLLYFLFVGSSVQISHRYLALLMPFFSLLVAGGVMGLIRRFSSFTFKRLILLVFMLSLLPAFMMTIETNLVLAAPDTRDLAREWMLKNLPSETVVVMDKFPVVFPPVTEKDFPKLERIPLIDRLTTRDLINRGARVIVISSHRRAWIYWDQEHFRKVVRSIDLREKAFYDELKREGRLLAEFKGKDAGEEYMLDHFGFHNPTIWIYELPSTAPIEAEND